MTDTRTVDVDASEDEVQEMGLSTEVLGQWESMLMAVPEAGGDESGYEGILAAIAVAQDPTELDAPWRSEGLQRYRDTPLVITGIRRMPSDYTTGLGWYLMLEAVVKDTGEKVATSVGSLGVVAQLVRAYNLDALPLTVTPRRSKKPSRRGYYAWHLEVSR